MPKKIITVLSLIFISGCVPYWYKPYGRIFTHLPPGGSPGYRLGWNHGCESGLGTQFAGAVFMTFYTWHKDIDIVKSQPTQEDVDRVRKRYPKELAGVDWKNPASIKKNFSDYNTVFWGGHNYCRQAALGTLQNAGMNPQLPGEERVDFSKTSIGNVYKIDGRGDARWGNGYW